MIAGCVTALGWPLVKPPLDLELGDRHSEEFWNRRRGGFFLMARDTVRHEISSMTRKHVPTGHFAGKISMIRCVAIMLALLPSGCAMFQQGGFESPDFELTSVRIDGLGLTGGSLMLLVDVDNPNSYDLRTGQIDMAIDFEGTRFGEAFLDGTTRFGPQSVTPIELPLSFNWLGVGTGARALLERGAIGYTLETKLTVDTPLGNCPIEMRTRGNVQARRLIR